MGSSNFLSAVTRGESNAEAIAILVGRLWGQIRARFSRVPPKQNPTELPTRAKNPLSTRRKSTSKPHAFLYRLVKMEFMKYGAKPRKGIRRAKTVLRI